MGFRYKSRSSYKSRSTRNKTSRYTKSAKYKTFKNSKTKNAYVYSLNLKNGKKYVGMTQNIKKRLKQHFTGNGAKWTKKNKPISINHIQKCKSHSNAKKAETIVYKNMRSYHGLKLVRGAGHTKSY